MSDECVKAGVDLMGSKISSDFLHDCSCYREMYAESRINFNMTVQLNAKCRINTLKRVQCRKLVDARPHRRGAI